MFYQFRKGLLVLLAVVFTAVLCCLAAFALNGNSSHLAFAEDIVDEVAVASVTFGDTTTTHSNMKSAFDKVNEYSSTEEQPVVITLLKDRNTNMSERLEVSAGQFVTLDLNGHKLHFQGVNTEESPITVKGTFTLTDRQPNTEHRYNINESGVYEFTEDGEHTLKGGVICGGYTKKGGENGQKKEGGGCLYVTGKFIMLSGNIAGNQSTYNGGGVYLFKGVFEMRGGMIAGNSSGAETGNHGGGVYSTDTSSIFTMSGGTIKDNVSGNNGGGVFINKGTFNLVGGTITGNTSKGNNRTGGGVHVEAGTLNISGTPVVTGNSINGKDNNLYLGIKSVAIAGELETQTPAASAQIGLTLKSDLKFTGYYNDNNKTSELTKFFTFDNGNCTNIGADGTCTQGSAHTPDTVWKLDGIGHWNECTICGAKVNYASHSGNAASCTEEGDCTVCNGKYGPNGHKFVHHAAVAATCTAQGYKEYWYCSVCDKNYADDSLSSTNVITDGITTPINANNHNFDKVNWVNGGTGGHYHPCLNGCDAQDGLTAHNTDGVGGVCSVCGYDNTGSHIHNYDQEVVSSKYFKSAATCTSKAVYYKSCLCGEKGTQTFEYGEKGEHDVNSIGITTQPTKKSYTALDSFDTSGMVVKTYCSSCKNYIDEVKEYEIVYNSDDDRLHAADESVGIEYGTLSAIVDGLTVAQKEVSVVWQYTESTNNTVWGDWRSEFVFNPDKEDLNTRVRATIDGGKSEYRATDKLVKVKKNGEIVSTSLIKNVGEFTLSLDEQAEEFADYKLLNNSAAITITPLTITLDATTEQNDFYWLLAGYDSALLSGYIDENYKYFSLNGDGRTKVERSIVRDRKKEVTIKLFGVRSTDNLGTKNGVYEITYLSGNTASVLGEYTAQAKMKLTAGNADNYVFEVGAFSQDRHMTATLQDDGSVLITKVWYIAQLDNALLSQNKNDGTYGKDWDISDWTYGEYAEQYAPRLEHLDPGTFNEVKVFESFDNSVVFELFREETTATGVNRVQIGILFNRYDFNKYINASVPAGSYVLKVRVTGDTVYGEHEHWYDGTQHDAGTKGVYFDFYEDEYRFKVAKAQFGQTNLDELENKIYRYTYDGKLHLFNNFVLDATVNTVRGGVWADAAYDKYYGQPELEYNLYRWSTEAYMTEQELASFVSDRQKPQGADTYTIRYKLVAPNYEDLGGHQYFTVIIGKQGVDKPADQQGVYSGLAIAYEVEADALYRVTGKESYTNAGSYDITLTLKDADNYAWKNADGSLSAARTVTVKLAIAKAQITVPENRIDLLKGKYVYTVPADAAYGVEGNAEFSEVGDYEITLKLKDTLNYEWKTADGKVIDGATVKTGLHLDAAPEDGFSRVDIWIILDVIVSVVIAGEIAYIVYRLLRKNKNTEGE